MALGPRLDTVGGLVQIRTRLQCFQQLSAAHRIFRYAKLRHLESSGFGAVNVCPSDLLKVNLNLALNQLRFARIRIEVPIDSALFHELWGLPGH